MDLNQIIINLMVVFMVVAVLDKCIGSQFGLGNKLDEALDTIGPMCIPMVGMFLLAPVIGELLSPVVGPLFTAMKADPAMFCRSRKSVRSELLGSDVGSDSEL